MTGGGQPVRKWRTAPSTGRASNPAIRMCCARSRRAGRFVRRHYGSPPRISAVTGGGHRQAGRCWPRRWRGAGGDLRASCPWWSCPDLPPMPRAAHATQPMVPMRASHRAMMTQNGVFRTWSTFLAWLRGLPSPCAGRVVDSCARPFFGGVSSRHSRSDAPARAQVSRLGSTPRRSRSSAVDGRLGLVSIGQ